MPRDYDWHTFDVLLGYDVRVHGGVIELRDHHGRVVTLTRGEFAQLRSPMMSKPKGLR